MVKPTLPPLNWLRAFEAAARHMSFTNAGREIGVTQSAISQNIRLLEAHLGRPLFRRFAHHLELTETGKAYLPSIQLGFQRIGEGTQEVFGPKKGEQISLRTTPGFADFWLAPRLRDFFAVAPDISIRMQSSIWDVEFNRGGDVLEIRYGDGKWPGMHCEKLTQEYVFPVTSPDVARELEKSPASLCDMRLFHTIGFRVTWARWLAAAGLGDRVDGTSGDHFDTAVMPIRLAEQGMGVALGRLSLVADRLEGGRLCAPLIPALKTAESFYLVWHDGTPLTSDAMRFVSWLKAAARDARRTANHLRPKSSARLKS